MFAKFVENHSIYVETSRNVIFSESKNHAKRRGGGIGVKGGVLFQLLKALTHSKWSYLTLVLKGVTQGSQRMSFNKLLYFKENRISILSFHNRRAKIFTRIKFTSNKSSKWRNNQLSIIKNYS